MSQPQNKETLLEQSCTYWSLTQEERQEVIDTTPKKSTWELELKRREDGFWFFDKPELKTYKELLVGNTELMLDHYYSELTSVLPDEESEMTAIVSTERLNKPTTILLKTADDPLMESAAHYQDPGTGINGWLCGWLAVCWGYAPDVIYVQLLPTN